MGHLFLSPVREIGLPDANSESNGVQCFSPGLVDEDGARGCSEVAAAVAIGYYPERKPRSPFKRWVSHWLVYMRSPACEVVRLRKVRMNSKHLLCVLVMALLITCAFATPTRAQTPPAQTPAEQKQKAKKELEQKALVMLDEIIKDAQSFKVTENRLRLKAAGASLLWKHDEARARILFKETMAGIVDLLNNQDEDDAPSSHMLPGITQLRREVVQMLATRDPRMARDFLRATRPAGQPQTPDNGRYGELYGDLQLEYNLATQITRTDPKQSLEIAEENLSKGFSYELINTLSALKEKDHEAAAKLANGMVAKLRSENLASNGEAANVAAGMLGLIFDSAEEASGKETKKSEPLLDQQGMRELLEMNINLALNSPPYSGRLHTLEGLMPQIQKYAPARVAELRRKMAQYKVTSGDDEEEGGDDEASPDWEKYQATLEKGTAEELLAAAAKAQPGIREGLYNAAAMKFAAKGDVDKAREIINKNIDDPSMRKNLLSQIDQQASLSAAEQGKMEQVRKSLANLRTNEERVVALTQIATMLAAKGEQKIARQLFEEAQSLVNYRARNVTQLGAQLMVVQAYARLNPERSLTMLEPIVDQLNELLAAAVTLGSFILDEEVMRDEEIRIEVFTTMLPFVSQRFVPDLRTLASFDFDRTRALAERFQRDEVRMMARLLVVQSVLGEEAAPGNPNRRMQTRTTTRTITATEEPPAIVDDDNTP
jgi:hypothetical protein